MLSQTFLIANLMKNRDLLLIHTGLRVQDCGSLANFPRLYVCRLRGALLQFDALSWIAHGELRSGGVKLLCREPYSCWILLQSAGDLVTARNMRSQLWQRPFVDFDLQPSQRIARLREVLGDSPRHRAHRNACRAVDTIHWPVET